MHTIYLDNAATSFPKPPCVGARMREYVDEVGASVGRGSYAAAQQAERVTLRLRQRLGRLFGFADPRACHPDPGQHLGAQPAARRRPAAGRPCAGLRDGAQRGHAPADPAGKARRDL